MLIDDTIAAVITAPGESGVGIIRISGKDAIKIANKVFVPKNKSVKLKDKPRYLFLGNVVQNNEIIDEVLCTYMKAPHSYTT